MTAFIAQMIVGTALSLACIVIARRMERDDALRRRVGAQQVSPPADPGPEVRRLNAIIEDQRRRPGR